MATGVAKDRLGVQACATARDMSGVSYGVNLFIDRTASDKAQLVRVALGLPGTT